MINERKIPNPINTEHIRSLKRCAKTEFKAIKSNETNDMKPVFFINKIQIKKKSMKMKQNHKPLAVKNWRESK